MSANAGHGFSLRRGFRPESATLTKWLIRLAQRGGSITMSSFTAKENVVIKPAILKIAENYESTKDLIKDMKCKLLPGGRQLPYKSKCYRLGRMTYLSTNTKTVC